MRVTDGVWAVGDVTGILQFTHVGKYQGRIAAVDMLGGQARADYRAVPRVVFTDPQAVAVGATDGPWSGTGRMTRGPARVHLRATARAPGPPDPDLRRRRPDRGPRGGPEAGEWIGQATLAIHAGVPLECSRT